MNMLLRQKRDLLRPGIYEICSGLGVDNRRFDLVVNDEAGSLMISNGSEVTTIADKHDVEGGQWKSEFHKRATDFISKS